MNKNKEKKLINLLHLRHKLISIKSRHDYRVEFELIHSVFILANLININISLYSTSYYNYNYSLLIFNALFLSRKTLQSIYTYYHIRSYAYLNLVTIPIYLGIAIYLLILLNCLATLFLHYSFNIILNLICPFTAYQFLAYSATSARYSDGGIDCFYSLQQISLSSLEILYCAGYLPYKFFPITGFYFNSPVFFNSLLVMFLSDTILHFGEFVKKRASELIFFAHSQGDWKKTNEMPFEEWQTEKTYVRGEVVKHKGKFWKGVGKYNNCEPGKYETYILTYLFRDPVCTLRRLNLITGICASIHNIYLICLPFQYSQVFSVLIFSYVLIRNISICKNLRLPNV
jgi:Putative transmembrane protein